MKKSLSIVLSIIVLTFNTGIAIDSHFCSNERVGTSISFVSSTIGCGMNESHDDCDTSEETSFSSESCCKNTHELIQLEEQFELSKNHINLDQSYYSAVLPTRVTSQPFGYSNNIWNQYPPPYRKENKTILFQVFII